MNQLLNINYELIGTISTILGGGALGGFISRIVNRKEIRRIKKSEAIQSEAMAKREDASAASEMMGLLERTVAHMEKMNSYNETNSESLLKMVREKDSINNKLKKDLEFLQLQRTEDHRRITGLEKIVKRELEWRKDSDYHYCSVVDCEVRKPPFGTFKRDVKK
ncbi:hypothetical protein ING2E5B_2283 [Fermentimonas caenicola]|jgi:hypothetical protein|uniref:Uncharacterized protein n=1 Tax=Fermentimonas caenicola TaxID=1562970 RepID=A0A098C281_9BACT|nr:MULTISPECIES: hypothetical protein [Bacteroidales]MBP6176632.1 hypothetical protein [Fermentimonas sp.]MCW1736050.1 hypothetical protein [Seramator thermalis]CEA17010.1 hypothetical protein ING2E5B_2283 [Fermentimonas caenicola]